LGKEQQPVEGGDEDVGGPLDAEGQVALLETLGAGESVVRRRSTVETCSASMTIGFF
jgi:hypothetical protein